MIRNLIMIVVGVGVATSCTNPLDKNAGNKQYFEVTSFLDSLKAGLNSSGATLALTKTFETMEEKAQLEPGDPDWEEIFSFFYKLDINKPEYSDLMTIQRKETAEGEVIYYFNKNHTGVLNLSIYRDENDTVRKIEGSYLEKSMLYTVARDLSLELDNNRLNNLEVVGSQDILFSKEATYVLKGTVVYP